MDDLERERHSGLIGGMYRSRSFRAVENTLVEDPNHPIIIHANTNIPWHRRYLSAFSRGFSAHSVSASTTAQDRYSDTDSAIHVIFANNFWQRTWKACPRNRLVTVNRCYFGNAHEHVAIGWGGFNGQAAFAQPQGPKRLSNFLLPLEPIRKAHKDTQVLVLGEYNRAAPKIGHQLRPHPQGTPNPNGLEKQGVFDAVAVYGGTTAVVDYVLRGYPIAVHSDESVAKWIDKPEQYTEQARLNWLEQLAWAQWNITEIENGDFWLPLLTARGLDE